MENFSCIWLCSKSLTVSIDVSDLGAGKYMSFQKTTITIKSAVSQRLY